MLPLFCVTVWILRVNSTGSMAVTPIIHSRSHLKSTWCWTATQKRYGTKSTVTSAAIPPHDIYRCFTLAAVFICVIIEFLTLSLLCHNSEQYMVICACFFQPLECSPAMLYFHGRRDRESKLLLRGDSEGRIVVWTIPDVKDSAMRLARQESFDKVPGRRWFFTVLVYCIGLLYWFTVLVYCVVLYFVWTSIILFLSYVFSHTTSLCD